jgi:hypothetical protein
MRGSVGGELPALWSSVSRVASSGEARVNGRGCIYLA